MDMVTLNARIEKSNFLSKGKLRSRLRRCCFRIKFSRGKRGSQNVIQERQFFRNFLLIPLFPIENLIEKSKFLGEKVKIFFGPFKVAKKISLSPWRERAERRDGEREKRDERDER